MITTNTTTRYATIIAALELASAAAVKRAADDCAATLKQAMEESGSGAVYARDGRAHQASAPGEPPAIDTRDLYASITVEQTGPYTWTVYSDVPYAPILEYGDGRLAPRPAWEPAAQETSRTFASAHADRLKEVS